MANSITDNRTLVHAADTVTPYVGSTSPVLDTDVTIEGTGSIAEQITNSRRYVMYNAGSTQNWTNNVFYIWINCGIVGLLDLKANGGFTIRFAGPTDTDFFEFYVGGSDSWPVTYAGGWAQFVVDIEATPSNTGGTPPAKTAIQKIGYSAVTATKMTKVADNVWMDEIRRLPDGSAGIIVQGRNGGSTDWKWSDLPTQLGVGVGTAKRGEAGTIVINTPIQFFVDDATTHAFTDNVGTTVLWEAQEWAPTDLYKVTVLGAASGTANFTLGVKNGTGDAAAGSLGTTIQAATTSVRWAWDSDATNIDACNLWGCTFKHAGDMQFDTATNSLITTTFVDCQSATVTNAEVLSCLIVNAATADGVAFMKTDDLGDIRFCSFEFSDGHAIELVTPRTAVQESKGNKFTGHGSTGTNDAAVYNNAGGAVAVNVSDSGDSPTYRNGASAITTVSNPVTFTLTDLITGTEVRIFNYADNSELAGIESSGTSLAYPYNYVSDISAYVIVQKFNYEWQKFNVTLGNSSVSQKVIQRIDINAINP